MALNWLGPAVTEKLERAQVAGVNQTMSEAVVHAKRNHQWQNQTATLEGSIDIVDFARRVGDRVQGLWGSRDVRYALIHELGGIIRPVTADRLYIMDRGAIVATADEVRIPARPYLRPAADAIYRNLANNIRRAFKRAS